MVNTILVADDETLIAALLTDLFEATGYRVLVAHNGVDALALAESARPDLLLTDNMMPYLSGMQLIDRLRASEDCTPPIILMSAVRPEPLPTAPVAFIPKPFDLDRMLALVADLLPS